MQSHRLSPSQGGAPHEAAAHVLREAKRLHRLAVSATLSSALPVLRRVLSSHTLTGLSLPDLFRSRHRVQRKHILRTLAIEAGFPGWETYRAALSTMAVDQLEHIELIQAQIGYLNCWFSSVAQAQDHAQRHGGRVVRVGQQAVVAHLDRQHRDGFARPVPGRPSCQGGPDGADQASDQQDHRWADAQRESQAAAGRVSGVGPQVDEPACDEDGAKGRHQDRGPVAAG